ncbi:enoyl-CoA hydratase [Mycolicibacterium murale]|uniref:Enoyl-CoA hydratase n=1 Tax=Mycolicibacterium murale TaxID=182220 RepID=A0A7I9WIY3_9MYCO|nr:crotonase/enoyl-CoA hydratase family protein [Mycolicibacterium murale]MCV7183830.1 crotonase/enoyl-CoA hydratase family protein [Mycolicibacterium murale]GFG57702.1 enoyl-CoA hydratase [Mycolicibacterium murale]
MTDPLIVEQNGRVQTWTINVPGAANAITGPDFITAFETAVDAANSDTDIAAVILTGAGRYFSAGGNVHEMRSRTGVFGQSPLEQRYGYIAGIQRVPRAMQRCEVPVIAAVNGAAIGAGCDLATMCDLRIASNTAFFAESFVQLGLIPGDGGAWFLPRAVGWARAAEMTFTGGRVSAATALSWGLVNEVVHPEALLTTAHELASRIAVNPVHAVRMAKRLLLESRDTPLDSALALAAAMQPLAHQDPEHHRRVNNLIDRQNRVTS